MSIRSHLERLVFHARAFPLASLTGDASLLAPHLADATERRVDPAPATNALPR